ncbi:response regulator transcription factor [Flavobacterium sediminilitoris]|uniref:Response regulator transcription factor n=1 Tax=Flavobacterium sediminilitoris TaxID=2024526 RepID=A0ABY4HIX1_9FLAO|nr:MULTISPECIES: response regulator transcription factor [Flavobacterium]UOX32312.1 response regulator transcription factor [Flavobacterium sediminilitoris]
MIKIAIVDDHQIVRQGLKNLLEVSKDFEVITQAANGLEFLKILATDAIHPDVVLLDLQMPTMDGYETSIKLKEKYSQIKIIILSQRETKESIKKVFLAGANGYLTKDTDFTSLHLAINRVYNEDFYFDMKFSNVIREAMVIKGEMLNINHLKKSREKILSEREIEIVDLISKEYNTGEIADKLCLNYRTIESHRKRIMTKVGAKNFIGVIIFAIKNGLITI